MIHRSYSARRESSLWFVLLTVLLAVPACTPQPGAPRPAQVPASPPTSKAKVTKGHRASAKAKSPKAAKPPKAPSAVPAPTGGKPPASVPQEDSTADFDAFPYDLRSGSAPVDPSRLPFSARSVADLGAEGVVRFGDDGIVRRQSTNGELLFSIGLPDATEVTWQDSRLLVSTRAGKFVLSVDGKILERPAAPPLPAFSRAYRFERLAKQGSEVETLWDGSVFGVVDGVWSQYGAGAFKPLRGPLRRTRDYHWTEGLLHLPGKIRLALVRNEHPGLGLEQHFIDASRSGEHTVEGLGFVPYEGLVTAGSKTQTAWSTTDGIQIRDNHDELKRLGVPGTVLRLHYQGEQLWAVGSREDGSEPSWGYASMWNGQSWIDAPCEPKGPVLAVASSGDTVWIGGDGFLLRLQGDKCTTLTCPLTRIGAFWAESKDSLWAAGDGGVAHFDGTTWQRVAGIYGGATSIAGTPQGDVLVSTSQGLFRGRRATDSPRAAAMGLDVVITPSAIEPDAVRDSSVPLSVEDAPGYVVRAYAIPKLGGKRYRPHSMAFVGGQLWLSDGTVTTSFAPEARALEVKHRGESNFGCSHCIADVQSRGVSLAGGTLRGMSRANTPRGLRSLRASGDVAWAVADRDSMPLFSNRNAGSAWVAEPQLFRFQGNAVEEHVGLPPATYFDLAVESAQSLWLAGARSAEPRYRDNRNAASQDGEGLLVHYERSKLTQYRLPRGPLLAVDVDARGGVWAVGVSGQLVTVAQELRVYEVPRRPWLRAVVARSPADVWIAGDRSTLLHFDGTSWKRIRAKDLLADQSLTAIAFDRRGSPWVLGQNVVYRIEVQAQ